MFLSGLCNECVHKYSCKMFLDAIPMDRNNTFNVEAKMEHCKQFFQKIKYVDVQNAKISKDVI